MGDDLERLFNHESEEPQITPTSILKIRAGELASEAEKTKDKERKDILTRTAQKFEIAVEQLTTNNNQPAIEALTFMLQEADAAMDYFGGGHVRPGVLPYFYTNMETAM